MPNLRIIYEIHNQCHCVRSMYKYRDPALSVILVIVKGTISFV